MADFQIDPDWASQLPAYPTAQTAAPQGNFFTSGLSAGFHEALANVGGTAQALGAATGLQPVASWGQSLAMSQAQAAQAAGRPDLEQNPWSLTGFGYQAAKFLPSLAGGLAAGAGAAAAAPEVAAAGLLGTTGFFLPQAVGGNVQAAEQANAGQLSPGDAAKSLLLGAPEALAMSVMPQGIGKILAKGSTIGGALGLGAYQGVLSGAQEAVTQQAFTPEMSISDRARGVVDAALQGGIMGSVFGGVASALHGKPAAAVTKDDLKGIVDNFTQPASSVTTSAAPPALAVNENRPFAATASEDLQRLARPLADLGSQRTEAQSRQHALVQEEIARRTQPGLEPGEGVLLGAEEVAQRAPAIEATRQAALALAKGGENSSFFQQFNAASEPELINSLQAYADKFGRKAPDWFKGLAEKYGVAIDGVGETPAETLERLQNQEDKSNEARAAALATGNKKTVTDLTKAIVDLQPKLAEAERVVQLHLDAGELLDKASSLPAVRADEAGQLSLPGIESPAKVAGERESPPTAAAALPDEGQLALFSPDELATPEMRTARVAEFQNSALGRLPREMQGKVAPLIRGMDVASEPELISALRRQHEALDGVAPPPTKAGRALGLLLEHFGVADLNGEPMDLPNERKILTADYRDRLTRVRDELDKGNVGQANLLFDQAQRQIHNSVLPELDQLIESHHQADELDASLPSLAVPDRVPTSRQGAWTELQQIKTLARSPATQRMADVAQRKIEQRLPHQSTLQLARNALRNELRAQVVTKRQPGEAHAVQEPGAAGVDVRQAAEDGGAVAAGHAEGNAAAQEAAQARTERQAEVAPARKVEPPAKVYEGTDQSVARAFQRQEEASRKGKNLPQYREALQDYANELRMQEARARGVPLSQIPEEDLSGFFQNIALDPTTGRSAATQQAQERYELQRGKEVRAERLAALDKMEAELRAEGARETAEARNRIERHAAEMTSSQADKVSRKRLEVYREFGDLLTDEQKTVVDTALDSSDPVAWKKAENDLAESMIRRGNAAKAPVGGVNPEWRARQLADEAEEARRRLDKRGFGKRDPLEGVVPGTTRQRLQDAVKEVQKLREERSQRVRAGETEMSGRGLQDLNKRIAELEKFVSAPQPHAAIGAEHAQDHWAFPVADAVGGDIVHADDNFALIRAYDTMGERLYLPVSRALGLRGQQDILSLRAQPDWLDGVARGRMVGVALKDKVRDAVLAKENPDGPFKDAQDNVVGTPNSDQRFVGIAAEILRSLGIGARVLVTTNRADLQGSTADKLGLNGAYHSARTGGIYGNMAEMRAFGPGAKDFYIHLADADSEGVPYGDRERVEALGHEIGHIVFHTALRNAPKAVRDAIEAAHAAFYKKYSGAKSQDIIRATRNRAMAERLLDNTAPDTYDGQQQREYFLSFGEWFADNVSRHITTAKEPTDVIGKFFYHVAQKLRELLQVFTGNAYLPDPAVRDFLASMGPGTVEQLAAQHQQMTGGHIPTSAATGPRTPQEADRTLHAAIGNLDVLKQVAQERLEDTKVAAVPWMRRAALGWMPLSDIDRTSRGILNSTSRFAADTRDRQIFADAKNKPDVMAAAAASGLDPKVKELVNNHLVMLNDGSQLDSRKTWAQHTWLHDSPDAPELAKRLQVMQRDLDRVQRAGGRPALEGVLQMMQTGAYQDMAALLHTVGEAWSAKGVQFEGHGVNSDEVYRGMTGEAGHDNPTATNAYYKNAAVTRRNGIKSYVDQQVAEAVAKGLKPGADLEALKSFVDLHDQIMVQAASGTYSPLGRGDGNYMVAGKLSVGDDKMPRPAALKALQVELDKAGFHDIGVFHDTASNTVMSRVESMAKMERLRDIFGGLEKAGHMLPGETRAGYPERLDTFSGLGPKYMQAIVEMGKQIVAETPGIDAEVADNITRQFVARALDMLPDNSPIKNQQPRKFSSGFDKDMIATAIKSKLSRNYSSTAVGMRGRIAATREAMRGEIQDLKARPGPNAVKAQDIANELWQREALQAWRIPNSIFDTMAELMHTLRIGFNPPYVLTMMSQIPTLSLPELGKKWGFAQSAMALAKAAPRSFAAIKAIMSGPDWATAGVRESVLRKAGIGEKDIGTLMRLDNAGSLSTATYTNQMAGLGEAEGASKYKKAANAMGTYAEMFPRIITAFAAGDLHDARPVAKLSRDEVVRQMVDGSQFNWGAGQSARMTGKGGPLGQYSRVAFQFTNFHIKMLGKLYTEMHDVLGYSGPEARKEAGRFLAAHLVAMTALAGTLGVPAAGAIAGLVDKLAAGFTGRDDIDVEGLYRTWLATTFGPGMGDVLAKGLPRGMGVDLSHLGEGDILPFTDILRDKRKFEDASRDWFRSMAGSAVGEAGSIFTAARDMLNGDYLRASIKMLPEGFKGLAEAGFLYKNGYIDKNGTKIPVQPGAMNILTAALGLDPANLAQYEEASRVRQGLMAQRQFRSQNITTHLLRAVQNPDAADLGYWIDQATRYTLDHPGLASPLTDFQRTALGAIRRGAMAGALNTPLGVSPLDTAMQNATGFITPQQ